MGWMVLEAWNMRSSLIKIFPHYTSKYFLKWNAFAWGVPLVFPIIGVAWKQMEYANGKT